MDRSSPSEDEPAPTPAAPRPKGHPPIGKSYEVRLPEDLYNLACSLGQGKLADGVRCALNAIQNLGQQNAQFLREPANAQHLGPTHEALARAIASSGWQPPAPKVRKVKGAPGLAEDSAPGAELEADPAVVPAAEAPAQTSTLNGHAAAEPAVADPTVVETMAPVDAAPTERVATWD